VRRSRVLALISVAIILFLSFGIITIQQKFFPFNGGLLPQGGGDQSVTSTYTVPVIVTTQAIAGVQITGSGITQTEVVTLTSVLSDSSTATIVTTHTNIIPFDQLIPAAEFPFGGIIAVLTSILALVLFLALVRLRTHN
jgi:hypothetical protein